MKNLLSLATCALVLSIVFGIGKMPEAAAQTQNPSIEGNWLGVLEIGGGKMRLVFKVTKSADGALAAKFDSPDQGANDLPIDTISFQERTVRFEAKPYGINFEGTLNEKGDEISGALKPGGQALPFVLKRVAEIPTLARPQEPKKPYPYDEEEVSYENKKDGVKIAGTLTLPRERKEPSPAVLLITGSGAQDRDETVFGHRPFLVLADYLTRRGIAVLRVDDRGIGGTDRGSPDATSENFTEDVLAGVEYLKKRKEINPKQIGLIGHSEGGMIAPMAAVRSKDIAFIVLIAGLGQTGEDVIYTQNALLQKADGESAEVIVQTNNLMKSIIAVLKTEPDRQKADARIREAIARHNSAMNEEQRKAFAPSRTKIEGQIPLYLTPWFRYFVAFNPRPTLEKVKVPVLAINGENDLQVSAKENLGLIEAALKKNNKDVTVIAFPKLNHLLQTSQTGALSEYGKIEETIAPVALETISEWILKRTGKQ